MRNRSGITLIELIVVIAIIGILMVALGFEFTGWRGRYTVESETRNLYNDLMNARVSAMNRNRDYFITWTNTAYTVYEDTYNAAFPSSPDGDGILQIASDRRLEGFPKTTEYVLCWPGLYTLPLIIDRKGFMSFLGKPDPEPPDGAQLRIDPDKDCNDGIHDKEDPPSFLFKKNPDYDCLKIMQETRIKMGKWNVQTNVCDIK